MIVYRTASLAELQTLLDWAAEEGWNPGLDDASAFYAADPDGFFVATENDRLVAGISVVNHNPRFAFLGLYIVRPELRGRGIGYALWQHALAHAEDRTVGLDGVPEQQANYAASGFTHAGGTTRFSGYCIGRTDPQIDMAGPQDPSQLVKLEASLSGQTKQDYLTTWFRSMTSRKTFVLRDGKEILGFCTARLCRHGTKIGPLFASDEIVADRLIHHAATLWDGPITIDVPAGADSLSELCSALDLSPGFETARMYRGAFETLAQPVFAVTSLELG